MYNEIDYELELLLDENDIEGIGEYLSCYGKKYYNRKHKCFIVGNHRFYPVIEDGYIVRVEED